MNTNKVFEILCQNGASIIDAGYPINGPNLADLTGLSINQVRYRLRKLKDKGLIELITIPADEESCFPWRGWIITEKAKETETYKKAYEAEKKACKNAFGIDIWKRKEILTMSTKYPVDRPEPDVRAYDTQTNTKVFLIDQLQTECGFTDYWLCEDYNGNLLICNVDNLENLHRMWITRLKIKPGAICSRLYFSFPSIRPKLYEATIIRITPNIT